MHSPINRKPPSLPGAGAHERHASKEPRAVLPKKQPQETVKDDDLNAHADQPQNAKPAGLQGARTARKCRTGRRSPMDEEERYAERRDLSNRKHKNK